MPQIRTLGLAAALVAGGVLVISSVVVAGPGPGANRFGPNAIDNVWVGTMQADSYTAPDGSRDKIIGRAGNDVLVAGDMRDVVKGNLGDDAIDVPVLRCVGLPITVANGHWTAKQAALWVTQRGGGTGALREVADGLLDERGATEAAYARWLSSVTPD